MSAMFGILHRDDTPVAPEHLAAMSAVLAHRGPDSSEIWAEHAVGLGQRMLWTTPESLDERLPRTSACGRYTITADARIDNRTELIARLHLTGQPAAALSDSALILEAYRRWGTDCPSYLIGDFAFAIWDAPRQLLFCARDPLGVKSLYYYCSEQVVCVASELKALFCVPRVPRRLNQERIADYLLLALDDPTTTFFQDVFRLQAAHSLVATRERHTLQRYWSLDPSAELRLRSDADYVDAFRELFTEAVRCRLRSAFPVGSTLSGGIDSSSIACVARDILRDAGRPELHTFSAIFPSLPESALRKLDERPYISAVVAQGNIQPHYIRADQMSPLHDLDTALWHQDEVAFAPNLYIHWGIYAAAADNNVRIVLDGVDGDTTVSHGLPYLTELAAAGRWPTLYREASALARHSPAGYTGRRIMWEFGVAPLIPPAIRQALRRFRTAGGARGQTSGPSLVPATVDRTRHQTSSAQSTFRRRNRRVRIGRQDHYQALTSPLLPYALEEADKAAGHFAIEPRYPFCDRRLVEFCLALPADKKLHQGTTRAILHDALQDTLPPAIHQRALKADLSPNFKRNFLAYEGTALQRVLYGDYQKVIEAYVDIDYARSRLKEYESDAQAHGAAALDLYRVVTLAQWLVKAGFTGIATSRT